MREANFTDFRGVYWASEGPSLRRLPLDAMSLGTAGQTQDELFQ